MKLFKFFATLNLLLSPIAISAHAQADRGGNGGKGFIGQFEFNVEQTRSAGSMACKIHVAGTIPVDEERE